MKMGKGQKDILLSVAFILIMLVILTGITMARYMTKHSQSGLLEAENFYFTSDFLKEETENAEYFIDPLKDSISVKLFNSADSQRTASTAVSYEVTADQGTVAAGQSMGSIAPGTSKTGAADSADVTILLKPLAAGERDQVTVTARSTSPYRKTLKAKFTREKGNAYYVEDSAGDTAAVLTMTCADSEKDITVKLPAEVIPDATDSRVSGYDGGTGTFLFRSPGYGVYSVVLLKSNPDSSLVQEGTFAEEIVITGGAQAGHSGDKTS